MDKIISSDKEVISTGSFLTFDDKPSTISIESQGEKINFELHFIEDENESRRVDYKPKDNDKTTLVMKFYNFNNPLGMSFTAPIHVGFFKKRQLYAQMLVSTSGKIREIVYTFYLGEPSG
jgi:hypothetical protein